MAALSTLVRCLDVQLVNNSISWLPIMIKKIFSKVYSVYIPYFFTLVCLISCSYGQDENNTLINTMDEFMIDIYQDLESDNGGLTLELSTLELFECSGYQIDYNLFQDSTNVEVRLNRVLPPEVCQGEPEVAFSKIPIEAHLEQNIELNIWFNDQIYDNGLILREEDRFYLSFNTSYGIKSYISELSVIPDYIITGFFKFDNISQVEQIKKLIENYNYLADSILLSDGYYGHFSIENRILKAKKNDSTKIGFQLNLVDLSPVEKQFVLERIKSEFEKLDEGIELEIIENIT